MAYQGEDIAITLEFDNDIVSLSESFVVLVYPTYNVADDKSVFEKSNVSVDSNGEATVVIPAETTALMQTGPYTIEVLVVTNGDTRSIYQQREVFPLNYAKIKDYKTNSHD